MTFHEQVRFARLWGLGSIAAGLLSLGLMFWAADEGARQVGLAVGVFAEGLMAIGAILLLFGGIFRPIHRWQWHNAIRHSVLWDGYYLWAFTRGWASPFWRRWLHIDAEGNDLDARP